MELIFKLISQCKLANSVGHREPKVLSEIESRVKDVTLVLDLVLNFVENMLYEFLDAHKTVCTLIYSLLMYYLFICLLWLADHFSVFFCRLLR